MRLRNIMTTIVISLSLNANAQAREPSENRKETEQRPTYSIYALPPFERAICCIKFYEGIHRKKDYPYVGYGHKLKPGETYSSYMSPTEAELLLRKDLKELCAVFRSYGKDSLLLAALAYNIGEYKILGCKGIYPKSTLLKKIEAGIRDFKQDYVKFCHWKGKRVESIERRRYAEYLLLYIP